MLSFASSLSSDSEAFAIFVTEKYDYKDKKNILSTDAIKKVNSFISALKVKKKKEDINSFDISARQKCFIIRVKNKYDGYFPQENGGTFFSYIKKFKDTKKKIINSRSKLEESFESAERKSINFFTSVRSLYFQEKN